LIENTFSKSYEELIYCQDPKLLSLLRISIEAKNYEQIIVILDYELKYNILILPILIIYLRIVKSIIFSIISTNN